MNEGNKEILKRVTSHQQPIMYLVLHIVQVYRYVV